MLSPTPPQIATKREDPGDPYLREAERVLNRQHLGRQLNAMNSDWARAIKCRHLAEDARDRYLQGQAESIAETLMSKEVRYKGMGIEERKIIGRKRWSSSALAKEIADDETLYCRWAMMFAAFVTADQS